MDYDNFGGTLNKINEYVENLKELKNCLTTELLESDVVNFDEINTNLDTMIKKLESIKGDISGYIQIMKTVEEHFSS